MKCDNCGEEIKWSVLKLDLPCYASTKELCFCDFDCLLTLLSPLLRYRQIKNVDFLLRLRFRGIAKHHCSIYE